MNNIFSLLLEIKYDAMNSLNLKCNIIAKCMKFEPNLLSYRRIAVVDNQLFSSVIESLNDGIDCFLLLFDKLCTFFALKNRVLGVAGVPVMHRSFYMVLHFPRMRGR